MTDHDGMHGRDGLHELVELAVGGDAAGLRAMVSGAAQRGTTTEELLGDWILAAARRMELDWVSGRRPLHEVSVGYASLEQLIPFVVWMASRNGRGR